MADHLVIGDPHAVPDQSNERFDWIGKLALDRRPSTIVCMGDLGDMESLSSYDRGKKDFEGRRFKRDIEAVHDALERMNAPIDSHNEQCARNKKAQYKPRKVMILGNHDDRISRAINLHPELDGTIGLDNLKYKEYGWEVIPYLQSIEIDGIFYSHYFPSGVKGEAVSGLNVAQALLAKNMVSSTVGHNHLLDYAIRVTPDGRQLMALSAGCYFDFPMKYASHTEHMWWKGLVMCNDVVNGTYNLETMHINKVKALYGG